MCCCIGDCPYANNSFKEGWNRAVEALCNRIEELDTDMFTPKQISEYLYDVFFKQED